VKDDTNVDYAMQFTAMKPRIRKEPYGTVLIIGTYNFPVNLNISPLIGAIAAGCTVVVKPSEHAPETAAVLDEIIAKYLDPTAYRVVNGAVPETTALLNQKWEKIFYTGGEHVAKIISKKAAETLTPVCLELGGRNPAFVNKSANIALAARRLLWGKCMNAGQVCISQNYAIVDRRSVLDFIKHLNITYNEFFPKGAKASPDFARIINHNHFDRIKNMLDTTKGKIVMGGETDRDELFIAPTAVLVEDLNDPIIQQESFGPVWGIIPVDNLDSAIKLVNTVDPTPLSLVTFGSKEENAKGKSSATTTTSLQQALAAGHDGNSAKLTQLFQSSRILPPVAQP
jgi:beta-apo-4'-carotenal oxygenase